MSRANRAQSVAYRPALELITSFATNWTIAAYATPAWARAVFPDLSVDDAVARLWDAIFAASRVDAPDPVATGTIRAARAAPEPPEDPPGVRVRSHGLRVGCEPVP